MPDSLFAALSGKRIALTRPRELAGDFEELVRSHGGMPVLAPAIAIREPASFADVDEALRSIATFDLIVFTSANAVLAVVNRANAIGVMIRETFRGRIAVVGPATAEYARRNVAEPDVVADGGTADSLFSEIGSVSGLRIFYPRGDLANPALHDRLSNAGATLVSPIAYLTIPDESVSALIEDWANDRLDAVLFASPSAVKAVAAALEGRAGLQQWKDRPAVFCLGPATALAARDANLKVAAVAHHRTQVDMLKAAAMWFSSREKHE